MVKTINVLVRKNSVGHCKHPAHSCVVGCKERGGALPTVTALTAQGMTIMRLFVVQVKAGTSHGDTQYSVNKQTNKILISHLQETDISS